MVSEKLSPIEQIKKHIQTRDNFVLNGGAGSGKTRSLIEVIELLYGESELNRIACITFTNVAADEITERVSGKNINLRASTIHDFLWELIKSYQKNLKQTLLELIQSGKISYSGEEVLDEESFKDKTIEYREWRKLEHGIISHNEVLLLANRLFEKFSLLRRILKDKYDFILIDEYQDTEEQVIQIFLDYLQDIDEPPIVGLFGDSMQSIYDKGIGDLQKYIDSDTVKEVPKEDNWRCAKSVINLINKIRNDGLQQKAAGENLEGSVTFLYSNSGDFDIDQIKKHGVFSDFDFNDYSENKELYLTHKLIAKQFGFEQLLNAYTYKENLTGDNPDRLAKHLFQIQEIIALYDENRFNEFIRKTDFKIVKNRDLGELKKKIESFKNCSDNSIEEVINLADQANLVLKDDRFEDFIAEHKEQYEKVKDLKYVEVINLFSYRMQNSPYSTQHGVKGAEFNNVFIVLDNGRWNQYNFAYLFEGTKDKESIVNRTRRIFYVCCSRSKENLVVFYPQATAKAINKAKEWFGEANVLAI